jgi:hypothetical protein
VAQSRSHIPFLSSRLGLLLYHLESSSRLERGRKQDNDYEGLAWAIGDIVRVIGGVVCMDCVFWSRVVSMSSIRNFAAF